MVCENSWLLFWHQPARCNALVDSLSAAYLLQNSLSLVPRVSTFFNNLADSFSNAYRMRKKKRKNKSPRARPLNQTLCQQPTFCETLPPLSHAHLRAPTLCHSVRHVRFAGLTGVSGEPTCFDLFCQPPTIRGARCSCLTCIYVLQHSCALSTSN